MNVPNENNKKIVIQGAGKIAKKHQVIAAKRPTVEKAVIRQEKPDPKAAINQIEANAKAGINRTEISWPGNKIAVVIEEYKPERGGRV